MHFSIYKTHLLIIIISITMTIMSFLSFYFCFLSAVHFYQEKCIALWFASLICIVGAMHINYNKQMNVVVVLNWVELHFEFLSFFWVLFFCSLCLWEQKHQSFEFHTGDTFCMKRSFSVFVFHWIWSSS